jgi:peptide chain release factor 2
VLQPYQMVKDLRTGVSTSNTGAVLDGDLDEFMQAALAQKAFGGEPAQVEDVE